jgi:hypothetical protein
VEGDEADAGQAAWIPWEDGMAEIKSTLDLVMEKTKGMTLSAEEKQAQEDERLDRLVEGLWRRVAAAGWSAKEFFVARDETAETDRSEVVRRFRARLIEALEVGDDLPAQVSLLSKFEGVDPGALAELEDLAARMGAARGRTQDELIEAERAKLAAAGISGSAVVPKPPPGWPPSAGDDLSDIAARLVALKPRLAETE